MRKNFGRGSGLPSPRRAGGVSLFALQLAKMCGARVISTSSSEARVVLAYQERGARYRLARVATQAARSGDAWTLSGTKSLVPIGDQTFNQTPQLGRRQSQVHVKSIRPLTSRVAPADTKPDG